MGIFQQKPIQFWLGYPLRSQYSTTRCTKGRLGNIGQTSWENLMVAFPGTLRLSVGMFFLVD
ncbi:hypothetical protein I7I48_07158 [Histoplasma ohiense]|nr:hypothetical protein I7I48_07158 [Histoplasma ohiense (nom. inval.)]